MTKISFILTQATARFAEQPALLALNQTLSYREYDQLTAEVALRLKQRGLKQGARVAILSPATLQVPVLLMALLRCGMVAVPVSLRLPEQELVAWLKEIGVSHIILPRTHAGIPFCGLEKCYLADLVKRHERPSAVADITMISFEQEATLVFTSGSSGQPKAALHTYGNHYFSALGSNQNIPVQPGDRWLLSLPLYHVGGLAILFRVALGGGAVVVPAEDQPLQEALAAFGVTHLSLVATQLYRLLQDEAASKRLAKLKAILVGGSAIPAPLIRQAVGCGLRIHTSYGTTEMASQITTTALGDPLSRLLTSGRVLPYRQVKIAADGEILVTGKTLFKGYLEGGTLKPERDREGWFKTGDLGILDAEGYLHVSGRKDNLFISGGENIQPEEIERQLCRLEEVLQAVVVPVPSPEFGARPVAFVRLRGNELIQPALLKQALSRHLPRFKIPDYFFPWPIPVAKEGMKPDRRFFIRQAQEKLQGAIR